MISLPLGAAAVVVVRKDLVIVNVTTGQQRAPARTTHGSGHVCVPQLGTLVPYSSQGPRHEVQRTWRRSFSMYTQIFARAIRAARRRRYTAIA